MEQYPLLKSTHSRYNHWSQFQISLKDIKLENYSIVRCQMFWDNVILSRMSTLQTNNGFTAFDSITTLYDVRCTLLPASTDLKYNECKNIYNHFSRVLHLFLTTEDIISSDTCPHAYKLLQDHLSVSQDVFTLITTIVKSLRPHLGGRSPSLEDAVTSFNIQTGETLATFHRRATTLYNEITLQRNTTGQGNALTGKYISLLYNMGNPSYTQSLQRFFVDWKSHTLIYENHLFPFKHTLHDVYQYITLLELPTTLQSTIPTTSP